MVFLAELIIIIIYYYTWDYWREGRKQAHVQLGFGYVALACISAVLISAILGFMLTPDGWPLDRQFWSAFLNPSYAPQLALRLSVAVVLGAFVAACYVLLRPYEHAFKREALRYYGRIFMVALIPSGLAAFWYFQVVPSRFKIFSSFALLTSKLAPYDFLFWAVNAVAVALLLLMGIAMLRGARRTSLALIVPAFMAAVFLVGEYERIREFIRGPYLVPGYMYANQLLLPEAPDFAERGSLGSVLTPREIEIATPAQKGAALFALHCSACHTVGGPNDIRDRFEFRPRDAARVFVGRTMQMVPFMPPFIGNEAERLLLADFLYDLSHGKAELADPWRFMGARETTQ